MKLKHRSVQIEYEHKPSIIFGIQQEVGADDGDADGDDDQNQKHEQHEAIDVVDLVRPERCEDEIPAHRASLSTTVCIATATAEV